MVVIATIQVVLAEPGKSAEIAEIGTSLKSMQAIVGGNIEVFYPFEEEVCIVCNDEGKFNGMRPCRAVYDENHNLIDIIFGSFFVCSCKGEYFGSLSPSEQDTYLNMFRNPEAFLRIDGEIKAVPYIP